MGRPKRGKKNGAETARASERQLVALRQPPRAVERDLNRLEHHGLNRGLDVGLTGDRRYVGDGVLSYNLPLIGRALLERARVRSEPLRRAA